jgi:hypothetical protein
VVSWVIYLAALLPIDLNDGASGWLLAGISIIGLVAGILAVAGIKHWTTLMWIAAVGIVLTYVLLWLSYAMTLSEGPPHASLFESLAEVAIGKWRLVQYIARAEGWLPSVRHAVWELGPIVQLGILVADQLLRRPGGRGKSPHGLAS